ncbi:MAG: tetratricopeptide repeat protein [Verrucomicrobiota bacterium]
MNKQTILALLATGILAWGLSTASAEEVPQSETNSVPATPADLQTNTPAILQLQEQYQDTLRTLGQLRQDAEAASKLSAEAVAARLNLIERTLTAQRQSELESMQSSNRLTLIIAGSIASAGFLALMFTVFFLLRAMNRQSVVAAAMPFRPALQESFPGGLLNSGELHPAPLNPAEQSSARFLSAIDQLEQRIQDLQNSANGRSPAGGHRPSNGGPVPASSAAKHESSLREDITAAVGEQSSRVALLLGKGQVLFNLNQAENALACFEEVITLEPNNTDALIKKGQALEKLRRMQDAIDSYDRVIAADGSLTVAYLYKGGVFNRLEQFDKALECYEQALRVQDNQGAGR